MLGERGQVWCPPPTYKRLYTLAALRSYYNIFVIFQEITFKLSNLTNLKAPFPADLTNFPLLVYIVLSCRVKRNRNRNRHLSMLNDHATNKTQSSFVATVTFRPRFLWVMFNLCAYVVIVGMKENTELRWFSFSHFSACVHKNPATKNITEQQLDQYLYLMALINATTVQLRN